MFAFGLKLTQVWVAMALLLLCVSICPGSCYPHTEEDEDFPEAKEKLDNDEDQELVHDDDDEDLAEEVEDDVTKTRYCIAVEKPCGANVNSRGLPCCTNQYGDFYHCGIGPLSGFNCIKIKDKDIQNELRKRKREEILNYKPEEIKNEKPEDVKKRDKVCDWYCKKSVRDRTGFRFLTRYCSCS